MLYITEITIGKHYRLCKSCHKSARMSLYYDPTGDPRDELYIDLCHKCTERLQQDLVKALQTIPIKPKPVEKPKPYDWELPDGPDVRTAVTEDPSDEDLGIPKT